MDPVFENLDQNKKKDSNSVFFHNSTCSCSAYFANTSYLSTFFNFIDMITACDFHKFDWLRVLLHCGIEVVREWEKSNVNKPLQEQSLGKAIVSIKRNC